jgi:prophage maintenance system killer protein
MKQGKEIVKLKQIMALLVAEVPLPIANMDHKLTGIRDLGALESSVNQPYVTFDQQDHADMETFLVLNGADFDCAVNEQEQVMLNLAAGMIDRAEFTNWVKMHEPETDARLYLS